MSSMTINSHVVQQGIYEESANQRGPLGSMAMLSDGRCFCYAKVGGTAAVNGRLYQGIAETNEHSGAADLAPAAAAVGDETISIVIGDDAITENEFADGFISHVNTGSIGRTFAISGHAAVAAKGTGVFLLKDPLWEAVAATDNLSFSPHPSSGVVIHTSPPTAALIGVPIRDITAAYYGWFQTRGPCCVLQQGTVIAGSPVEPSLTVDGAVGPVSATSAATDHVIGTAIAAEGDGDCGMIFLRID